MVIYENKPQLEMPTAFAGLFAIIIVRLAVEKPISRRIETRAIHKRGM
jgi:NitT/TauT family transport system permease protein